MRVLLTALLLLCVLLGLLEVAPYTKSLISSASAAYLAVLAAWPLLTKCCTSVVGFAIGDVLAQLLAGLRWDAARTARFMMFGWIFHAPGCHLFYRLIDRYVMPDDPTSVRAIVIKILLDRVLFTPINMGVLFLFNGYMERQSLHRIFVTACQRLPNLWLISNALWPAAHAINFRYVPPEQRVLFVNCVSIIWNIVTCGVVGRPAGTLPGSKRHA